MNRSFPLDAAALLLLAAIVLILLVPLGHVRAEPLTTYRDSMGRVQGYATKHGNATTFTDAMGRQIRRVARNRDGTTTFYNDRGQTVGSSKDTQRR